MRRDLEKRVTQLERSRLLPASAPPNFSNLSTSQLLDELLGAAWQVKELAISHGDYQVALACVDSLYKTLPLRAKLRGELDQAGRADVFDTNLDDAHAFEIAEMFLKRHNQAPPGGGE